MMMLLLGVVFFNLSSCKKDDDVTSLVSDSFNGVLQGRVSGNIDDDSTSFVIDYIHAYEYDWDETWYDDNGDGTYDIFIERYADENWSNYSYIEIDDYNPLTKNGSIETYIEAYGHASDGRSIYYWGYGDQDMYNATINNINFDPISGDIDIQLTTYTMEDDYNISSTGNLGSFTQSYSGQLKSSNVVSKISK